MVALPPSRQAFLRSAVGFAGDRTSVVDRKSSISAKVSPLFRGLQAAESPPSVENPPSAARLASDLLIFFVAVRLPHRVRRAVNLLEFPEREKSNDVSNFLRGHGIKKHP
jgi:hypothetical protein